jgi:hypothetical protein
MSLRYVANISWPRSGHGLFIRILQAYLGTEFNYCEFYGSSNDICCKKFPCKKPTITMSKNHDFQLNTNLATDEPAIIQIRAFIPSIISWFEMSVNRGVLND